MKVTLNKSGLKKLVEHLEAEYPGISKKVVIKDDRLVLPGAGVELVAITELLDANIPAPTPSGKPDPSLEKSQTKPATIIGKMGTGDSPRAVGRAGTKRVDAELNQQKDAGVVQQAIKAVADRLNSK